MRITIEKYKDGFQRVSVKVPLHGDGYLEQSFYCETVPVVTVQEDVQAEIFLPKDVVVTDCIDGEAVPYHAGLSVFRKLPPSRR